MKNDTMLHPVSKIGAEERKDILSDNSAKKSSKTRHDRIAAAKRTASLFTAFSLACSCCACGSSPMPGQTSDNGSVKDISGYTDNGNTSAQTSGDSDSRSLPSNTSGLRFLCSEISANSCSANNGFYYLSQDFENTVDLGNGNQGTHLMYMDYASCQEVFLCSAPGCTHETADCTAVLDENFPPYSSNLFLHGDSLYILSRKNDFENSADFSSTFSESSGLVSPDNADSVTSLYRMNPDGTEREKVYTFDSDLIIEGTLAIDDNGLYAVAKKLSTEKSGDADYASSSQRTLVFLDLSSFTVRDICSLDFGDNIVWQMTGCANGCILLEGTDYEKKPTEEEYYDDDKFAEYYENSSQVFASLDIQNPKLREFYRTSNKTPLTKAILGDTIYLSRYGSEDIIGINTATGEEKVVASLPQSIIWDSLGDNILCCRNSDFSDYTYYFVNVDTGDVMHSSLVNKSLGWTLEFKAETDSDVLVIYDYAATPSELNEGGYTISMYQYGLISKEDLYSGVDNFRAIRMSGKGY